MGCGASTESAAAGAGYAPPGAAAAAVKSPLHGGVNAVTTRNPGYAAEFSGGAAAAAAAAPGAKPSFAASYVRGPKLGKGNYATVYKVSPKGSNKVYAAKVIKKASLTPEDMAALAVEVKAMAMLRQHPNFVHIVEHISERDYFYIVLELIEGGELFDRICRKEHYSERDARVVMKQLAGAIAAAHSVGVVHRDLKPENILLASLTDDTTIKVADLGFARITQGKNIFLTTPCGTPAYVAPEVISNKPYTASCDVWSLGVILYLLLAGYPPFNQESQDDMFRHIREGNYSLTSRGWPQISAPAKDLVSRMLTVEPARRITCEQILSHPWLTLDASLVPNVKLVGTLAEIKKVQARRRFKRAIEVVLLTVRLKLGMASRALKAAKSRGLSPEQAEAEFYRGAQAQRELRSVVEARENKDFPAALVAGGRRVMTHQFKVSELAPPVSQDALARARTYG